METRGVCGQEGCRETRYYLENGLWFCRRGHQQEGRQIEEDPEDYGMLGKTSRIKKATAERTEKRYRGRRAITLYLQIYQLILWKQSYALVQDRGFPAEFEHVVRDLWALRLQTLSKSLDDPEDSEGKLFSSQGETDTEAEDAARHNKKAHWPKLLDTVALSYVAALLMRLPVTVADMYRMAMRGDFPFIRVLKSVPSEMRDKLPSEFVSNLETKKLVKSEHLHTAVQQMILLYHRKFDMLFPPLNWPLILFQYIKRLALPVEIYPAVKNLQNFVHFKFAFPTKMERKRLFRSPDTQLVTLIVIATKLFFPFDKIRRQPESVNEPTTQVMDWTVWEQAQRHFENREAAAGHLEKGKELLTSENDVFSMTTTQMDEYLDWYENSWLISSKVPNPLADLFPTGRTGIEEQPGPSSTEEHEEQAITNMLHDVTSQMILRRPNPNTDSDVPRPGSQYKRYRWESDLPEMARPFYETVAKVAGISLHTLVRAVFETEMKISRWQEDRRRREVHGEPLDMGMSDGESEGDEDMSDGN